MFLSPTIGESPAPRSYLGALFDRSSNDKRGEGEGLSFFTDLHSSFLPSIYSPLPPYGTKKGGFFCFSFCQRPAGRLPRLLPQPVVVNLLCVCVCVWVGMTVSRKGGREGYPREKRVETEKRRSERKEKKTGKGFAEKDMFRAFRLTD